MNDTAAQSEIVPRRAELVPRRTQPPRPPHRPPIHRTWLRELFTPPPVHSYLAGANSASSRLGGTGSRHSGQSPVAS